MRWLRLESVELSLFEKVWLAAPIAVWCSYQPFVRLGQDSTMYFELSVTLLYLVVLSLAGVPALWRSRHALLRSKAVWLVSACVFWVVVSLAWTDNVTRGVLTIGVLGALYLVFLATVARMATIRRIVPALLTLCVASAVVMSVLALVQFVGGIWLARDITLLCAGCVAEQFGFVRPNVFAIEPQFFGSLLLAPALVLLYRLMTVRWVRVEVVSCLVITTGLFLTLSRGAIFAFALGVLVLLVVSNRKAVAWARVVGLTLGAFALSLLLQGVAAAINPTVNETFMGATTKVINQLSLGVIDLAPVSRDITPQVAVEESAPAFDGYVEESTDVRVNRSTLALHAWASSPLTILFGVGVGGAGVAVHNMFPEQLGAREIVQNQYVETLLEQGVVGLVLFVAVIAGLLCVTRQNKWVWAIILAFLFQWNFFSGYPNALHIYLILAVIYATARRGSSALATQY